MFRRVVSVLVAAVFLSGAAIPVQAHHAKTPVECSEKWWSTRACGFLYSGEGLSTYGYVPFDSQRTVAVVRVEVHKVTPYGSVVLLRCVAAGREVAGCSAARTAGGVNEPEVGEHLICVVQGSGVTRRNPGEFGCGPNG